MRGEHDQCEAQSARDPLFAKMVCTQRFLAGPAGTCCLLSVPWRENAPALLPALFFAAQIDLDREPEVIQGDMQKNVRYKIRRAEKDGLRWEVEVNPEDFVSFHDAFAQKKGIEGVDLARDQVIRIGNRSFTRGT